jgi:hypothetical protein
MKLGGHQAISGWGGNSGNRKSRARRQKTNGNEKNKPALRSGAGKISMRGKEI